MKNQFLPDAMSASPAPPASPTPPTALDDAMQQQWLLTRYNTFGIAARARGFVTVERAQDLPLLCANPTTRDWPRLVLGGGSNILLTADFPGLVLHVCISGMAIVGETASHVLVHAGAGVNWHALVSWTLAQGLGGLENLSLIPGTAGAAPIQNIGAYGAELKQVLHSVQFFDFASASEYTIAAGDCALAYRDSVFKHALQGKGVITGVVLALPKLWHPNLSYAELAQALAGHAAPTPQQISDTVCAIRRRKLPDPGQLGNAGSFFKNPVVDGAQYQALKAQWPQLVSFVQADGRYKLAAGWLIDQCGWKGRRIGDAGVYEKQALVLVNHGNASGAQMLALAQQIRQDVAARFGVQLEAEPVFV